MGETQGIPKILLNKIGLFFVFAFVLLAYLLMSSTESAVHYSWMIPVFPLFSFGLILLFGLQDSEKGGSIALFGVSFSSVFSIAIAYDLFVNGTARGSYVESSSDDYQLLFGFLNGDESDINSFNGSIQVTSGKAQEENAFTLINSRSVAENIVFSDSDGPLTGSVLIEDGALVDLNILVKGDSLLHTVPLTTQAFKRGLFGEYGQYIVSIGLVLFAFSTAIAWSYYGDRAMTYLFGSRSVLPYRMVYVVSFFYAALADTTLIWNISLITIVLSGRFC